MFTGIISSTTHVNKSENRDHGVLITFELPKNWGDLQVGESVSTNGVCLTVEEIRSNMYLCFLMRETLSRSTFGRDIPSKVNLERALQVHDRINGHFVQGHIDDIGRVVDISKNEKWDIKIEFDEQYIPLVVEKGSIALNGISLTISNQTKNSFSVSLIPFTLQHTTLGDLEVNDVVNLEFDILGKYINHLVQRYKEK